MTTEKIEHDGGEGFIQDDGTITIAVEEYERLTKLEIAITSAWPIMWKLIQPTWNQLVATARDAGFDIPESVPTFGGACTGEPEGPHTWTTWTAIGGFPFVTKQRRGCTTCGFTQCLPL